MRAVVYVSGPMTKGDRIDNLAEALRAYRTLVAAGYSVICPQFTYFVADIIPQAHETWLAVDLPIVAKCDAVVRLPGESVGADMEVACAARHGVPVYSSVAALIQGVPS